MKSDTRGPQRDDELKQNDVIQNDQGAKYEKNDTKYNVIQGD